MYCYFRLIKMSGAAQRIVFLFKYKNYAIHLRRVSAEDSHLFIPKDFAHLIRITLSKLAGSGDLQSELINQNFWKAWPRKFTSAACYAKRKDTVA